MKALFLFNAANLVFPAKPYCLRRLALRLCGLRVGEGARISNRTAFYGKNIEIGAGTWVGPMCSFYSTTAARITIGMNCDLAPEVVLVTGSHILGCHDRRAGAGISTPITIGNGCWIGARATILGGVSIGAGSIVAAGAVLRPGEYPADVLLAGVPARMVKPLQPYET